MSNVLSGAGNLNQLLFFGIIAMRKIAQGNDSLTGFLPAYRHALHLKNNDIETITQFAYAPIELINMKRKCLQKA